MGSVAMLSRAQVSATKTTIGMIFAGKNRPCSVVVLKSLSGWYKEKQKETLSWPEVQTTKNWDKGSRQGNFSNG